MSDYDYNPFRNRFRETKKKKKANKEVTLFYILMGLMVVVGIAIGTSSIPDRLSDYFDPPDKYKTSSKKSKPQRVVNWGFECHPGGYDTCGYKLKGIKKCLPIPDSKVGYWGKCVTLTKADRKKGLCLHGENRPCGDKSEGTCSRGSQECLEIKGKYVVGKWQKNCYGYVGPQPEVCDGLDNDCDGVLDNGLKGCDTKAKLATLEKQRELTFANMCVTNSTRPCGSSVGTCSLGIQYCLEGGVWDPRCEGAVWPTTEECDGLDNDCNGKIDDGLICPPPNKKGAKK